ncbi:hypothetical protein V6N13_109330 [Hibiscus sabdariffa]
MGPNQGSWAGGPGRSPLLPWPRDGPAYDIVNTQARPNNIHRTLMGDYWQAAAMLKQSTQTLVPIGQRINSFGSVIQTANFERWYGNNLISEVQEFRGSLYVASPSVDFIGVYTI